MNAARERILAGLRARLGDDPPAPRAAPDLSRAAPGDADRFCERLAAAGATVERIPETAVPRAVMQHLSRHNLAARVTVAPALQELDWGSEPLLEAVPGIAGIDDPVAVVPAAMGIAETGSLVHASGGDNPTTNHFLPDHVIAVVADDTVCADLDSAFARLAQEPMPRAVCLITGPSRTGDIEQRIELGAHGPRSLHVLVTARPGEAGRKPAT